MNIVIMIKKGTLILTVLTMFLMLHGMASTAQAATITDQPSVNWGGYVAQLPPSQNNTVGVNMDWHIENYMCHDQHGKPLNALMGTWPGLGGVTSNLFQLGVATTCTNGVVSNDVFFEFPSSTTNPNPVYFNQYDIPYQHTKGLYPVSVSDHMNAQVAWAANGGYVAITMHDYTKGWFFKYLTADTTANSAPTTAEWIMEVTGPSPQIVPQFSQTKIFNCTWVSYSPPQSSQMVPMTSASSLNREIIYSRLDTPVGPVPIKPIRVTPSKPDTSSSFFMNWNHN